MKVAVVGGGITGLACAFFLTQSQDHQVTLYEKTKQLGGKIRESKVGELSIEEGPDVFVTRSSEIFEIISALGIQDQLTHPSANRALIYRKKALHPLPLGLTLGFPTSKEHIFGNEVLTQAERLKTYVKWLYYNARRPRIIGDDLGQIFERSVGRSYTNSILDPLLGGINAATVYGASAEITAPQVLDLLRGIPSTIPVDKSENPLPPFASFKQGLSFLVKSLSDHLQSNGVEILRDTQVSGLRITTTGVDIIANGDVESFDKVILATPSSHAGSLLKDVSPICSTLVNAIRRTSVTMSTVLVSADLSHIDSQVSGVLIPRSEPYFTTAITLGPNKWPSWQSLEAKVLRISSGRLEDRAHLSLEPKMLVHLLVAEAMEILGTDIKVEEYRVTRWDESFARFSPYHRQIISKAQRALSQDTSSKVGLAGSYLLGSGIPTCVKSAKIAVTNISAPTI